MLTVAFKVQRTVREIFGIPITIDVLDKPDIRSYKADCSLARDNLGFNPRYWVEDMVDSVAAKFGLDSDFDREEHRNIAVFERMQRCESSR